MGQHVVAACAGWRKHDAVAVSGAIEQLHGRKGAGKVVDKNVAEIVGV